MTCWRCNGEGRITAVGKGCHGIEALRVKCPNCDGTGVDNMPILDETDLPLDGIQGLSQEGK